jgi:hypothetical protein
MTLINRQDNCVVVGSTEEKKEKKKDRRDGSRLGTVGVKVNVLCFVL